MNGKKPQPRRKTARREAKGLARELKPEELEECKEAFKMFDHDGNGSISKDELALVMRLLGNNPTPQDIDKLMTDLDTNKNGCVEFDEFLVLMSVHLKEERDEEKELRAAFEIFDRDGNNKIDKAEIRHVMKSLGEKMTDDMIDELLSWADDDGDGMLNYEEFVKVMMQKNPTK